MSWKHFFKTLIISAVLILAGIALVLLLLSALGVVNPDAYLRRLTASRNRGQVQSSFTVTQDEGAVIALGDSCLVTVGHSGAAVYSSGGSHVDGVSCSFDTPAAHAQGDYLTAYDAGGRNAAVFSAKGCMYRLSAEADIISATAGSSGMMALCTKEERYLGAVTVYSTAGEAVYKVYSAEGYPIAAQVAPDGERLAVLRVSEKGSFVDIYDMHETESGAVFTAEGAVVADLVWLSDRRIMLLGRDGIWLIDGSGEEIASIDLGRGKLLGWAHSSGFITLVTESDGMGDAVSVMTLDTDGRIIASADFGTGVSGVHQCGKYLAVTAGERLIIYNKELENCDAFTLDRSGGAPWMRVDGTAAVISGGTVWPCG